MRKVKYTTSSNTEQVQKESPLSLIKDFHIEKYGWGGSCIKAYRISKNMNRGDLARRLKMREHKLAKYEDGEKPIGIKLAKQLSDIFSIDWHIFRKEYSSIQECQL